MKNQEEKLKEKYGVDPHFKVPQGYFDRVYKEIGEKLPAYPEVQRTVEMTRWQRIKPYVYLAAMFAGIWCMMQMFHIASSNSTMSLENPPEQVALAMANLDMNDVDIYSDNVTTDFELEREVSEQFGNMAEFEKAFGYELEPQYEDMKF